jgi:hypothetical protein
LPDAAAISETSPRKTILRYTNCGRSRQHHGQSQEDHSGHTQRSAAVRPKNRRIHPGVVVQTLKRGKPEPRSTAVQSQNKGIAHRAAALPTATTDKNVEQRGRLAQKKKLSKRYL